MKAPGALTVVLALASLAWLGTEVLRLYTLFGIVLPYLAFALFVVGFIYRVAVWGRSVVPFRIPTTCGQQQSLPWIRQDRLNNPSGSLGVIGRMLLEVLAFRSLLRNTKAQRQGEGLGFGSAKWLWLAGLAFHWSMLLIVVRHLRFFLEPVPAAVRGLDAADSFFQIALPLLYLTDVAVLCALTVLVVRRIVVAQVRYISLFTDYFALFLLIGVALAGILMRFWLKVDLLAVKEMTMGLASLHPTTASDVGAVYYVHVFLVSCLLAYFPWSKLMHAGGIFLSPTRNLSNNSRVTRHANPWDYPVQTHSYAEYEDDYRAAMVKAGLPTDSPIDEGAKEGGRHGQAAG